MRAAERTSRRTKAARWGLVAATTTALLTGLVTAQGATASPPAHGGGNGSGGGSGTLQADVEAVQKAGGGKVRVLAQTRDGHSSVRARTGAGQDGEKVPWGAHFRTASTTKTFTAAVALQLVAEGRVSLDDTVEKWLPGVVSGNGNDGSRITVRDLLQQTSGLFDYVEDPEVSGALGDFEKIRYDRTPAREYVAVAMRHAPLFTPDHGTGGSPRWAYSNTNYLLAQMIIEKAGERPYGEQVERRIIAPLKLRNTTVTGTDASLHGPHARVTIPAPPDGAPLDVTEHTLQHTADSAVVSTTADINSFYRALMTGKVLPAAGLAEMQRTVARTDDPEDIAAWPDGGYGLGLRETPLSCGGSYWHHEGDGFGSYTRTGVTADGRRSVAVSVTSDGGLPDQVGMNAATRALVDHALCGRKGERN